MSKFSIFNTLITQTFIKFFLPFKALNQCLGELVNISLKIVSFAFLNQCFLALPHIYIEKPLN